MGFYLFVCVQNVPYIPILFATLHVAACIITTPCPVLFIQGSVLYFALCSLVFQTHFLLHVLIKCFGTIFSRNSFLIFLDYCQHPLND